MKNILLAIPLIVMTSLGGCAGFTAANVAAIEAEVQADTNLVCGFIPTLATIAAFIPGVGIVGAGAASIAEAICGAIAAAPPVTVSSARLRSLRQGGQSGAAVNVATVRVPNVGLVPISGQFTR